MAKARDPPSPAPHPGAGLDSAKGDGCVLCPCIVELRRLRLDLAPRSPVTLWRNLDFSDVGQQADTTVKRARYGHVQSALPISGDRVCSSTTKAVICDGLLGSL